jgi:hypothetical protein
VLGVVTRKDLASVGRMSRREILEYQFHHTEPLICLPDDLFNESMRVSIDAFLEASHH